MRFFDKDHGPEPQDDDDWGEENFLAPVSPFSVFCKIAFCQNQKTLVICERDR